MAITKAIKDLLQRSSNNVPEKVSSRGSNAMRLKLVDGKSIMLMNKQGKVTEYGKYWYDEVKKESRPRDGFDPNTEIIRRPNTHTDYIRVRNGQEQPVRVWLPGKGKYSYTKLGRQYFAERPRRYIVSIPTITYSDDDDGWVRPDNYDSLAPTAQRALWEEHMRQYRGFWDGSELGEKVRGGFRTGLGRVRDTGSRRV